MSDRPDKSRNAAAVQEQALASRAQTGDADAFVQLVMLHNDRLYNFIVRRFGFNEEARDICQEAFVRAWQAIDRFDPAKPFRTWLYTIANRVAIDHLRARTRQADHQDKLIRLVKDETPETPEETAMADAQRDNIWSIADRVLTGEQRAALWLKYVEDRSAEEIAETMDKNAGAIRALLFRARKTLAQHLENPDRESA